MSGDRCSLFWAVLNKETENIVAAASRQSCTTISRDAILRECRFAYRIEVLSLVTYCQIVVASH